MKRVELIWGTAVSVDTPTSDDAEAIDATFAWFDRVDGLFSTWRDDSQIVRYARGSMTLRQLAPEVREVLELADRLRADTDGAFDVRATAQGTRGPGWCTIDPSGIVKGWAVDRAAALLGSAGVQDLCINAGGDVAVRGAGPTGGPWRVGIQHPGDRASLAAVVTIAQGGVATSGRYERGAHIVDPRSGRPARGLQSVTIVGPDLARADAYATAVMALGADGPAWVATRPDVDAWMVTDDNRVLSSPGFRERWIDQTAMLNG